MAAFKIGSSTGLRAYLRQDRTVKFVKKDGIKHCLFIMSFGEFEYFFMGSENYCYFEDCAQTTLFKKFPIIDLEGGEGAYFSRHTVNDSNPPPVTTPLVTKGCEFLTGREMRSAKKIFPWLICADYFIDKLDVGIQFGYFEEDVSSKKTLELGQKVLVIIQRLRVDNFERFLLGQNLTDILVVKSMEKFVELVSNPDYISSRINSFFYGC